MILSIALILIAATLTKGKDDELFHPDYVYNLNKQLENDYWKAAMNFRQDTLRAHVLGLMGFLPDTTYKRPPSIQHDTGLIAKLPKYFDARQKWPNCPSLNEIRDVGSCGSSWAAAAAAAMTDRVCIYSKGTKQFHFSTQDLTSCVSSGCFGGHPGVAWDYWVKEGIVCGGQYNSSQGCRPYELPPCEHFWDGKRPRCREPTATPDCVKKCTTGYNVDYSTDKRRGKKAYVLSTEDDIKAELYNHGPVETSFDVYEDFVHYKSGAYIKTKGKKIGVHTVKILGWGVEYKKKKLGWNEVDYGRTYWLCANSWGTDWGDKGFFKILRWKYHLGIGRFSYAGEPDLTGL